MAIHRRMGLSDVFLNSFMHSVAKKYRHSNTIVIDVILEDEEASTFMMPLSTWSVQSTTSDFVITKDDKNKFMGQSPYPNNIFPSIAAPSSSTVAPTVSSLSSHVGAPNRKVESIKATRTKLGSSSTCSSAPSTNSTISNNHVVEMNKPDWEDDEECVVDFSNIQNDLQFKTISFISIILAPATIISSFVSERGGNLSLLHISSFYSLKKG
ncbi:hypothetical protein CONCODRAFT_87335 [Conidiobolus coronatus NRRL 28638]|uniref:Uncharacterized protein n=1 Tax=Conidiobolus coronatus (strain ATCC 28846 / CBS 209.66 / NRRL 28638) TaxID=796925 RepID=A0A137NVH5_CONC2|nr:hypothetical protein CONCODRAFT_87335 [Conidiobolus coronatus NRRL 28638]|eukprot:KXN66718.1 hypothetical protein CONCODRAFT_87335 [Conidiobolus coronatus NRRL 28638]